MRPDWPLRTTATGLLLATVVSTVIGLAVGPAPVIRFLYVIVAASWLTVSVLILERQPGHAIGRIMLAFGALMTIFLVTDVIVAVTFPGEIASVAAWLGSSLDGPLFLLVALLFLLFPDGHPPSARWRGVIWLDVVAALGVTLGATFKPGPFAYYTSIDNPFGIPGFPLIAIWELAYLLLIASVGLSALSLVGRWRRGGPLERAQLKWVAAAAGVVALAMGGYAFLIGPGRFNDIADLTLAFAFGFFPVAIGIAILRYRLFEIDRLVSRTIAYVILTAVLVGAYAGAILLLQGPLGFVTGGDTVPVAISTLVVAALFQPLRRRVQSMVDRRFDRARFDAEQTTVRFAERLREDVDIESVTADLRATVEDALRPRRQGLWLRQAGAR